MIDPATLPKEWTTDASITGKARAMCRRHTDRAISDYLGIPLAQVESIRRNRLIGERGRPRSTKRADEGPPGNRYWDNDAILGSARLAERINEVFGRRW
jgi:hypothetical protein